MSKIPDLTAASTPDGTELIHVVQSSNSRKLTVAEALAVQHGHAISDVTGLQTALDNKIDDSQADAGGLAVLGAADAAGVRAAAGLGTVATLDVDTDSTLTADSDGVVPSQAAVKSYVDASTGGLGALLADNNLSDLADAAAARTNLGLGSIAVEDEATAAQIRSGTASKAVAADKLLSAMAIQTLTDGATVSWDLSAAINAKVTLGGNRTLAVSNPVEGMTYSLGVNQDATGSRTMTWPSSFNWGTTGAPTLTTTASKRDRITLICTDAATPAFDAFLSGKGF